MQELIFPHLQKYLESHTSGEPPLLKEIDRQTHLKVIRPRMLSGHYQGRLLSFFSKLMQPRFILEIGTYTAYSAICLAEGLQDGGRLITIDNNEELSDMIRQNILSAGLADRLDYYCEDAIKILPTLNYVFDLVFIDADKQNYPAYYEVVMQKTRAGGLILIDNVLWSGKVLDQDIFSDKTTVGLADFNEQVHQDDRVENILLPVRDGIMALRKK